MTSICSATHEYRCIFTTSDHGSDTTTTSGVLVLTPSGSTSSSAENNAGVQSADSFTPTAYLSPVLSPSVTSSTAEVPSLIDVEDILINKFGDLTFREKQNALAAVGKLPHCDSAPGSAFETETEIWPKTHTAKTYNNRDTSNYGNPHDGIKPNLGDWQVLCIAVGVAEDEIPNSINKCKKVRLVHNQSNPLTNVPRAPTPLSSNLSSLNSKQKLKSYNINLSDLSSALRNGTVAHTFPSVAVLARYTKREGKVMSKTVAKRDPLLKAMLREFPHSSKGRGK
jgi:hypothetical protein